MNEEKIKTVKNAMMACLSTIIVNCCEDTSLDILEIAGKDPNNITIDIDRECNSIYQTFLRYGFGYSLEFVGEEFAVDDNHINSTKLYASIDPVDGTDLVRKALFNWGTALFFFRPSDKIEASFVGVPSVSSFLSPRELPGSIYYTTGGVSFKHFLDKGVAITQEIRVPCGETAARFIKDASIAFYGQKAGNLLSFFQKEKFVTLLEGLVASVKANPGIKIPLRIYNFGGNPMMVKLIDGHIDAVVDVKGQKLYDVIPGALIAQKAGAIWGDLNGNMIDDDYLKPYLSKPTSSRISYILATTIELYNDLLDHLR